MHTETFKEPAHTRTVSPSAHPRPASGGATDFFLASALSGSPTGLATSRWRRRATRPIDFCHPNELRAPAPRAFPAHSHHFRGADAPRRLRLRTALPGDRTFHDVRRTASADRHSTLNPCVDFFARTWVFSSHGADAIEPLTPLSQSRVHPHASLGFPRAALWPYPVAFGVWDTGRRMRRPPRPP